MANKVFDYYKELPSWAKGAVVVGGIAISYFVISRTISRIRKAKDIKDVQRETNFANQDLLELARKGIKPTIDRTQMEIIIKSLEDAMNGCGANQTRIENAFKKLNNEADLKMLIRDFGVRYYTPCAISSPISYAIYLTDNKHFGGSLATYLNYDLSTSDINKINKILADKKINFKF
jgi:hypothetical protein